MSGSFKDTAAALSSTFSHSDISKTKLEDLKPAILSYLARHSSDDSSASTRLQDQLKATYKEHVQGQVQNLGAFVTVLSWLRPSMVPASDIMEWVDTAVMAFVDQLGSKKSSMDDAQDFVVQSMLYDEDAPISRERAQVSASITRKLLDEYMTRTKLPESGSETFLFRAQNQAAKQLQDMLLTFGRRKPKDLFKAIDDFLVRPDTRLQALNLLGAFVEEQQVHLDLVVHTSVVEHLLKCLMNDAPTVVVSAALRCLIMLLPHIPATVSSQLPRLFLIYSRCLCWEKFSDSSSRAEKDHVTDDRVRRLSDSEGGEHFTIDPTWNRLCFSPGLPESSAPELLNFFTYLYGLYPLNLTSYIRRPRKYLKTIDFPGADEFDLDQDVIRSRTEQFQRAHLLHPSFFNTTAEEELTDNRWLKAEPSEVVAECLGLFAGSHSAPANPGPPPMARLPALPALSPLDIAPHVGSIPVASIFNMPSGAASDNNWRDAPFVGSSGLESPTLPHATQSSIASPRPSSELASDSSSKLDDTSSALSRDAAFLQRELVLIRNELQFERYLKQQHVAAIGQLKRNHIKAVTMEAETATLINANRALQKKLIDANKYNEKVQKETQARRAHTKQSEDQLTAKIRSLRSGLDDQESLQATLQKAAADADQLRQLLVESEAREVRMRREVESREGIATELDFLRGEVAELRGQLRTYQTRETSWQEAQAEHDMVKHDLDSTRAMVLARDHERERLRTRISELESRLHTVGSGHSADDVADLHIKLADAQEKQLSTKHAYAKTRQELAEMKLRFEELSGMSGGSVQAQAQAPHHARSRVPIQPDDYFVGDGAVQSHVNQHYPPFSAAHHTYGHQLPFATNGSSFPPNRPLRPEVQQQRLHNVSPLSRSEGSSFHDGGVMLYRNNNNNNNNSSSNGGRSAAAAGWHDGSSSYTGDSVMHASSSAFSVNSEDDSVLGPKGQDKIKAKSEIRIYGRGGAQNIKMKDGKDKEAKKSGMPFLKGLV